LFLYNFKNTKGVFTWNDFKYDFIPLFEIIRERLRVDRKVEYFTKSYTKNAEATDIIDDNIEDDCKMIGVIIRVIIANHHKFRKFKKTR
jgi:hypothetical protein